MKLKKVIPQGKCQINFVFSVSTKIDFFHAFSAVEFYLTSRDIFHLYRATTPAHDSESIQNNAAHAMLFHNDCTYIAYHLLTLGYQFSKYLTSPWDHTATFVDMVPGFRKLAEGYFRLTMVSHDLLY